MRRVLTLALGVSLAGAAVAEPRGFTATDLVQLDRVGSPALSPDGKTVAYTLREADLVANKARTGLWRVPVAGGAPQRLTGTSSTDVEPQWSADGQWLYFLSTRSSSMQVWRLPMAGGEAQQVTDYPLDIGSYKLSPSGKALALSMDVFVGCDTLECTTAKLQKQPGDKTSGMVYDGVFMRHWDTWSDGRRSQLFYTPLDAYGQTADEPIRISGGLDGDVPSKPFGDASEYAFAPDGKSVVFSMRVAGREEAWSTNFDLYRAGLDGKAAPKNLTEANKAWDTAPVFSADGKSLYYLAMKRPGFEADRFAIMAMPVGGGTPREIAPDWDRSAGGMSLSPDGKLLYVTADDLGQHPLFAVSIADGSVKRVADRGTIAGYSVGKAGIVLARDTLTAAADLYFEPATGGAERQLTDVNKARLADVRFGDYQQFSFSGWNDETVHGYVVKPWNYQKGRKYPVAFIIHGGPQGSMGDHFHYRWNPQTYAGQGMAVVFIDFHGSSGYGQAFTDAISQHWGDRPLEDLQKGWAAAQTQFDFLDGDRACALGASYGGYMTYWIAGVWNQPWKCFVDHDGVFDNRMMGYATEELWFSEWENGGTPYDNPEGYEKFNPINHVKDWRVPMLVIHGELDYRIPSSQGMAAFTALQRKGIPSQFLYFPDENHWVLKPQNSVQWHESVNAWLKRWTAD
ncbi:MAG: S9 family peptidase [Rhodanobacteraceae bacterium]|nr:S9 family peptidase [Xanthomonadales bacterium]MCP5477844.1 S9 family peptidase [Rhodanobacteraceae bacterium]HPF72723.1 S9 family peptidase [Xanthomonadaceae bacterium]HRY00154.1 S9 family peptidase [Xanthomonadaceae bacterium]